METYDVVILGSGAAGTAAALEAAERHAKVLVVERAVLGGTCVNVGCVPSKYLLWAAEAAYRPAHPTVPGVGAVSPPRNWTAVQAGKAWVIEGLRTEKYANVLALAGVPVRYATARFVDAETVGLDGEPVRAWRTIVATGARPTLPPIPGLVEARPWTYVEALHAETQPRSLAILGAGPVGVELAQAYARLGTAVTLLEAAPRILPQEDDELSRQLQAYLEAEGVTIRTGVAVERVERDGAEVRLVVSGDVVAAEELLVATGRHPDNESLGLEAAGVATDARGFVRVDAHMATTSPSVFAAGDVAGLPQYVYVAALSGRVAAANALGEAEPLDLTAVPRVTFTDPAVAAVGPTEAALRAQLGTRLRVARLPWREVPHARVGGDDRGLIKWLLDDEGRIHALHVLAPHAGDLIQEGVLAVRFGLRATDLLRTFHPYLTRTEGLRLALQTLVTDVHRLSCCA